MRFVIQRVTNANVVIEGEEVGKINRGFCVLVGVENDDTTEICDKLIKKMIGLRIFEDEEGKTNLDIKTVGGELLIVSHFTLYADCKKGNRPSFIKAGAPDHAESLYNYILDKCSKEIHVEHGDFGADMKVSLTNDGPFTIILDSAQL